MKLFIFTILIVYSFFLISLLYEPIMHYRESSKKRKDNKARELYGEFDK